MAIKSGVHAIRSSDAKGVVDVLIGTTLSARPIVSYPGGRGRPPMRGGTFGAIVVTVAVATLLFHAVAHQVSSVFLRRHPARPTFAK